MAAQAPVYWATRNPRVTEEAGTRGGTHMGADLAANRGDPVYAPLDGTVIFVGGDGASGYLPGTSIKANGQALVVRIRRGDGLIAHVAHMDAFAPGLRVGQTVAGGQTVIGAAGDTGWSTGVHVHQEFRWDLAWNGGRWINPRSLTPLPPIGDDDMFSDADRNLLQQVSNAIFYGGPSLKDGGKALQQSLAEIAAIVRQPVTRTVDGKTVKIAQIQDNADTNTMVRSLLAQVGALTAAVQALSVATGADPAAIAKAAEEGARKALQDLTLKPVAGGK